MKRQLTAWAVAGAVLASMTDLAAQQAPMGLFATAAEAAPPVPFAADTLVRSRFVRLATQGDDRRGAAPAGDRRLDRTMRIAFFPDLVETFEQAGVATPNGRGGVV
jgi:hypothetical protein